MKKLLRYFFYRPYWQRLPMLPRMYSSDYTLSEVDRDTQTLMQLTATRCPQGVEVLKRRHGGKSSQELIRILRPRRHKRRVLKRLLSLFQRWFGLLPYDPMKSIARQDRARSRDRW